MHRRRGSQTRAGHRALCAGAGSSGRRPRGRLRGRSRTAARSSHAVAAADVGFPWKRLGPSGVGDLQAQSSGKVPRPPHGSRNTNHARPSSTNLHDRCLLQAQPQTRRRPSGRRARSVIVRRPPGRNLFGGSHFHGSTIQVAVAAMRFRPSTLLCAGVPHLASAWIQLLLAAAAACLLLRAACRAFPRPRNPRVLIGDTHRLSPS